MAGRKKGTYQQSTRVQAMVEALRQRQSGMTLQELAERFEISTKQVTRDLAQLESQGHDLAREQSAGERMRIVLRADALKPIDLTMRERYALLALRRAFDVFAHTPLHEDVTSLYAKISAGFPVARRAELEKMQERLLFLPDGGKKRYAEHQDVLDELMSGVLYRARVAYTYRSPTGKTHRSVLEPYALVIWRQGLYVVGRRENADAPRVFAIERFVEATYQRKTLFEVPASFRTEDHFKGVFGIFARSAAPTRVVVDFSARCAEYVRSREWHPEQTLEERPRGGLRLSFYVSDTTQVLPWVLGWGSEAQVIAPAALAEEVTRNARLMVRRAQAWTGAPSEAPREEAVRH